LKENLWKKEINILSQNGTHVGVVHWGCYADMVFVACDALSKLGGLNRSQLAGSNGIGFVASDRQEGRLKNRFRRPLRMIAGLAYAP
jgi:hypothetical protein